jgi:N-acetyl-gamma-glutamylphosphate reductase
VQAGAARGVSFSIGEWEREVAVGDAKLPLYGLVEVMDNNPLVCADAISIPGPAATMALIAIAPLAQAGLIADAPVLMLNFAAEEEEIILALKTCGWDGGVTFHTELLDLDGVYAATVMAAIRTPDDLEDLDALYDEQFGRSFYIRRDETSEWDPSLVKGKPYALYRLRISPDEPNSMLTIRILSDQNGKCGAAQIVHAMNVMCGFEESLGIS